MWSTITQQANQPACHRASPLGLPNHPPSLEVHLQLLLDVALVVRAFLQAVDVVEFFCHAHGGNPDGHAEVGGRAEAWVGWGGVGVGWYFETKLKDTV
jgi:hypothetical protein